MSGLEDELCFFRGADRAGAGRLWPNPPGRGDSIPAARPRGELHRRAGPARRHRRRGRRIFVRFGALQGSLTQLASAMRVEGGAAVCPAPTVCPCRRPSAGSRGARDSADDGQRALRRRPRLRAGPDRRRPGRPAARLGGAADDQDQDARLRAAADQAPDRDPGVTLKLSGGWIIEADEVLVGPGAAIIVSDRGERTQTCWATPSATRAARWCCASASSTSGRSRRVRSRRGAGAARAPRRPAGAGAGGAAAGPGVVLDVSGGAGGQGKAGRSCY